jgi:hypothetical protein
MSGFQDLVEQLASQERDFSHQVQALLSQIAVDYKTAAENLDRMSVLYLDAVTQTINKVEKTAELSHEFIKKCEHIEESLTSIDELGKQVNAMRQYCELLEKKVMKVSIPEC